MVLFSEKQPMSSLDRVSALRNLVRRHWVLFKDLLVAGTSFVLDVALFALFLHWFGASILLATILARVLSSIYNFAGNRFFVFRGRQAHGLLPQLAGYVALVVLFMMISAGAVSLVVDMLGWPAVPCKIVIDVGLYICSFLLRKAWLFRVQG